MLKLEVTKEAREGKEEFKDFDMAAYSKATFGMYHGEKKKVKIQCHNHLAGVFFDRFGKDISFRAVDEDHSEFAVDVNVSHQFYGWIFGLGKEVKVVGPSDVVDDMRKHAEEFLAKYR